MGSPQVLLSCYIITKCYSQILCSNVNLTLDSLSKNIRVQNKKMKHVESVFFLQCTKLVKNAVAGAELCGLKDVLTSTSPNVGSWVQISLEEWI
jgi:hypothetical protein